MINVELLQKVKAQILKEPKSIDMRVWCNPNPDTECGTAACIAGWAVILDRREKQGGSIVDSMREVHKADDTGFVETEAADLLGLDNDQLKRLFFRMFWPNRFRFPNGIYSFNEVEYAQAAAGRRGPD